MPSKFKIIRAFQFACLGLHLSDRPQLYKIYLKISNKCNFSCHYCFSKIYQSYSHRDTSGQEMNSKNVYPILQDAWNLGCRLATFGGLGEVSTHTDFYQFLKTAKRMGYIVNFTTNGWNIDLSKLSILEPVDRIRISIDKMHLEGSPNPHSYTNRLTSIMEECINLNLPIIVVRHGESTPEIDQMLKRIGVRVYNYPLLTSITALPQYKKKNTYRCIDPWICISVESDLTVNPCSCSSECSGSIKDGIKLKDVWFGDHLTTFRKMMSSSNPPPICRICDRSDRDLYQWCKAVYNNKSMI